MISKVFRLAFTSGKSKGMKIIQTDIKDLLIVEPTVWQDERGYFFESFRLDKLAEAGLNYNWLQENEAYSQFGVIRGLHFQKGASAQAKLVRVISGEVLDVAVDLRPNSVSFQKVFSIRLSGENKKQLLVPRGFAHGYAVLSKEAIFSYKCDNYYDPREESGVHFLDPVLNIDWIIPANDRIVADKDKNWPFLINHE